jgi:hypothetical protein
MRIPNESKYLLKFNKFTPKKEEDIIFVLRTLVQLAKKFKDVQPESYQSVCGSIMSLCWAFSIVMPEANVFEQNVIQFENQLKVFATALAKQEPPKEEDNENHE